MGLILCMYINKENLMIVKVTGTVNRFSAFLVEYGDRKQCIVCTLHIDVHVQIPNIPSQIDFYACETSDAVNLWCFKKDENI